MNRVFIFILAGLLSFSKIGQSQEEVSECVLVLKDAERLYDEGKLESVSRVLEGCLQSGFNKEEKIQAYRLLTLTYLFDDNQAKAEESMANMLKIDPEHKINKAIDPQEFIQLYDSYRHDPIATFGINGGVNISRVRVLETFSIGNSSGTSIYFTQAGFQAGLHGSYLLFKNFYVNAGASFKTSKFIYYQKYSLNTFENASDTLSEFGQINNTESHSWIRVPVTFSYDIKLFPKFKTYLTLGGSVGYMISSSSEFQRTYPNGSGLAPASGPKENMQSQRNNWNYWLTGGLGFKYKISRGSVFLDVRYNYGLRNMTTEANRYSNYTLLYKYYYVDDNFVLDDIAFTIGYSRLLYKPKKKGRDKKEEDQRGYKRNLELE